MLRPLRLFGNNTTKFVAINSNRSKIVYSESFLDKAERLKLWERENQQLFGSVIEIPKSKSKIFLKERVKKELKSKALNLKNETISSTSLGISHKTEEEAKHMTSKSDLVSNSLDGILPNENKSKRNKFNLALLSKSVRKNHIEIMSPHVRNGILTKQSNSVPSIIVRNLKLFPMLLSQNVCSNYAPDNNSEDVTDDKILRIQSTNNEHKGLPSVSKILDVTMSPESRELLDKWKKEKISELGAEGFEKFYKAQLESGSKYHELMSKHLLSPQELLSVDQDIKGVWASVSHVLKDIRSPKAVESHVVHPVLKYKGIIDCVAIYQNKPMLIEWKKSDKPKQTLSATYDNPIQLAAYFGAISHDPNYKGLNVRDALLVIAYTDGSPADTFHISTDTMRQHWAAWLSRLEKFWAANENKNKDISNIETAPPQKNENRS